MAEKNCPGGQADRLTREADRLARRRALEDIPVTRVDARAGEARRRSVQAPVCSGGCAALVRLAQEQNKLLCDILGAVNALTAARLADCQKTQ